MGANGRTTYGSKAGQFVSAQVEREESVEKMVRDMRRDPFVGLAERVLTANIQAAQVTVTTASADPRTRALAATLDVIWWRHLRQFTEAFAYGRVAQEIVWAPLPGIGLDVVQSIDELPYDKTEMRLKDGEFDGIDFHGTEEEPMHLAPLYSWWLAVDVKPLEPHGKSRYRGAMQAAWEERREAVQRRRTFLKKYALGDLVFKGPQWEERDGQKVDVWREFSDSARSADGGDVLCFDPGAESIGTDVRPKYEILKDPIPAKDGTPLLAVTDKLGEEILLACGIPPKTVIEGAGVGSFALVTQQMLILFAVVEDLLSQIGQSYQVNVIDKARTLNGVDAISWNFTPLTKRPNDLAMEVVRSWLTTPALSPLITSGAVDVAAILDGAGIPVSDKVQVRLQAIVNAAARTA